MKKSMRLCAKGFLSFAPILSATAEPVELEPLIVYGKRVIKSDLIAVPGSDTIIPLADLQSPVSGSLADLLESHGGLPVLSFYGDPGLGSPVVRGFGENASSRTLILLDGIPVGSPDLSANPWFQFPVSGLEQLSILRGSRTVRYGSGALGGVIALETRASDAELEGSLETLLGSFASETYRGRLSLPLGDWSLGVHLDRNLSEGYRASSGFDSTAWSAVLQSPENERFAGRWFLSGSDLEFENPGSLSRAQFVDNPRQSINERFGFADQFINQSRSIRAAQKLLWKSGDDRKLTLNASWLRRERESNFGPGSHSDQDLDTWFLEGVFTDRRGDFSFEIGLRSQLDQLDNSRFAEIQRKTLFGTADLERGSFGAFILARQELSDRLALTAGIGWDRWSLDTATHDFNSPDDPALNFSRDRNDDGLSAELSLELDFKKDWTAWLRYDRIYRFPVADEIAAYQGYLLAEPFNADLAPERGHGVELGWEFDRDPWRYQGALFSQWLEGEIGFDFRENLNVNFADTRRLGLENRLDWQNDSWAVSLNHSLTFARYRSGDFRGSDVPLVPRQIFSGRVDWSPIARLSLGLEALHVGSSPEGNDFENSREELPSRWLFNSSARWKVRENLDFHLKVENLLAEHYATLKYQDQWYPGNGRKLVIGLKYEF